MIGEGPNRLRHRIEHDTLLRGSQLSAFGRFGIVPVVFSSFGDLRLRCGRLRPGRPDPEGFPYLWRWRDLLRANPGLRLAWGTDWPYFDPSPLRHLYGFVTRRDIRADGSICHPQPQIANDTISMARALRAMTLDAAYALGTDGAVGSLQPGKLADLVVLSADPRSVPPDDIPAIQVLATVVGGVTRFCAPPAATVCP